MWRLQNFAENNEFHDYSNLRRGATNIHVRFQIMPSSGSRGGQGGHAPSPVKISHKKDGRRRCPHRFHVSRSPPPYPAAGSATHANMFSSEVHSG